MTFREMNLAVFRGEPIPHVLFQPRLEPWLAWNKQFGTLSSRLQGMEVREVFRELGCSMRYIDYYTDQPHPISMRHAKDVVMREEVSESEIRRAYETPHGELRSHQVKTQDDTWREVEFLAKTPDDLRGLAWLFARTEHHFEREIFAAGDDYVGDLGVPQFYLPKSPYQALAQTWMKLEDLVFALADEPAVVEDAMRALDESYAPMFDELCDPRGDMPHPQIINLGENLHEQLISPRIFESYYLPWYEKRMGQLRGAGIFTHIHLDGYFSHLLPYLPQMAFDGVEGLTPKPQGDLELGAIHEHIGDKVLLDGIPAVLFMENYPVEELMAFAERLVEMFRPRLVLGASDEVPEACGEDALERLRMLSDWCRSKTG